MLLGARDVLEKHKGMHKKTKIYSLIINYIYYLETVFIFSSYLAAYVHSNALILIGQEEFINFLEEQL